MNDLTKLSDDELFYQIQIYGSLRITSKQQWELKGKPLKEEFLRRLARLRELKKYIRDGLNRVESEYEPILRS